MRPLTAFIAIILFCFLFSSQLSWGGLDYAVKLKATTFTPERVIDAKTKSAQLVGKHILIQFKEAPDGFTRECLTDEGIEILDYVPNYTYTAKLNGIIDQAVLDLYGIRWFDGIDPVNKISPVLSDRGVRDWARRGEGRAQFCIVMHRDEDIDYWAEEFHKNFQAEIIGLEPSINAIDLILPEQAYYRLADMDAVVWVKMVNRPPVEYNENARACTGAAVLQEAPYNLKGFGMAVAEWDGGLVDETHPDLDMRVIIMDETAVSSHSTHVAGTVIGNGANSGGQYRGMVPQARILSFLWWHTSSEATTEYAQALYGNAKVSTNSWGLGLDEASQSECENMMGEYYAECGALDNIIHNYDNNSLTMVVCWAAGNQRGSSSKYCGSIGWTYNTVAPYATAKNVIAVGAIGYPGDYMSSFSSWGPCDDGRIKPDVVGPGVNLVSCIPGGGYAAYSGTSMATPAVSGTITQVLEQGKLSFPNTLYLASTIKGIVINTAKDLGPVGPDYMYGYGKIDGVKAVDKIMDGDSSYIQAEISTGESHEYDLTVPSEAGELRVTLVWDDPGAAGYIDVALINDLDIVLVDPFNNEAFPWLLDGVNPAALATTGEDHLNVVEDVTVYDPIPGLWKARVSGYNIPEGPQKYSLVFTPDNVHTPGNTSALAVFDSDDQTLQPGQVTGIDFWVANVGASSDSIGVVINDNLGWTDKSIDTTVFLNPYDSVYYSLQVTIPGNAIAWTEERVTCQLTSKTDPGVTSQGNVVVTVDAYYIIELTPPDIDSIYSPEEKLFYVDVSNQGNDYDGIRITPSDQLDWLIKPTSLRLNLPPKSDTGFSFTITVLPEEEHLLKNMITLEAISDGGAYDQVNFELTVSNPNPPPELISPEELIYTQERALTFSWMGEGDSYNLYIATDEEMTAVERVYTGILETSFTMPLEDSLDDGGYYWAVRKYIGTDSSSLQRYPYRFIIDNQPPAPVYPSYPIDGEFIGYTHFLFYVGGLSKISGGETTPEFSNIEICKDTLFEIEVRSYGPFTGLSFQMPDTLDQGIWYWRLQRADSAGNVSAYSATTSFGLDTETPSVPLLLKPTNGGNIGGYNMEFRWTTDEPAPYAESNEFYFIQISYTPDFANTVYATDVHATILTLPSDIFEVDYTYYWHVRGKDSVGHSSSYQESPFTFIYTGNVCGDINGNGGVNISDVTYLVAFLFGGGPEPVPFLAGSVNGDYVVNISDVTYLVAYLFGGGPVPFCRTAP